MASPDQPDRAPAPGGVDRTARTLSIIGFVLAAIALIVFPPIFGLLAVILGIIAHVKGDPLGKWVIGAGIAGAIIGIIIGIALLNVVEDPAALGILNP